MAQSWKLSVILVTLVEAPFCETARTGNIFQLKPRSVCTLQPLANHIRLKRSFIFTKSSLIHTSHHFYVLHLWQICGDWSLCWILALKFLSSRAIILVCISLNNPATIVLLVRIIAIVLPFDGNPGDCVLVDLIKTSGLVTVVQDRVQTFAALLIHYNFALEHWFFYLSFLT